MDEPEAVVAKVEEAVAEVETPKAPEKVAPCLTCIATMELNESKLMCTWCKEGKPPWTEEARLAMHQALTLPRKRAKRS